MKNKKLFAILTLVCFMMTLMPVAAFAAALPVTTVASSMSAVFTDDTDVSVAGQTPDENAASFGLSIRNINGALYNAETTTTVFVWVTKDSSTVPVNTVRVGKTADALENAGQYIYEIENATTGEDQFAVAFNGAGTFKVHVSAVEPEVVSGRISNADEFNGTPTVTVTSTNATLENLRLTVTMPNEFKYAANATNYLDNGAVTPATSIGNGKYEATLADGGVASALAIAANNVDEKEIKIELSATDKGIQAGKTLKISSAGAIEVSKESVTTNAVGQASFKVSGSAEGTYKVYVTYGQFETVIEVKVGATAANSIEVTDEPSNPIDILNDDLSAGLLGDYVEFTMYDVNGNEVKEPAKVEGWAKAKNSGRVADNYNSDYAGYVAITSQPSASKLENKDLSFDGATILSAKPITAEGTYTFKVVLDNGNYATVTIEVKEFTTPVQLIVEYPEAIELGSTVTWNELYWLDANKVEKKAYTGISAKVTLAATGYAIDNFNSVNGELTAKTDEKYIGQDITITAIDERYNLVATAVVSVADDAKELSFATKTAEVKVNNKIRVNIVDSNGKTVALGNKANAQNTDVAISYVILDKPEDARVFVSTADDKNVESDGYFDMNLTSNAVGNVTVQAVLKYSYTDKTSGTTANQANNVVKYYTGTQIFAVGTGSVGDVVVMSIGSNEIIINDKKATIDAEPMIQNDRTYVPFRALAEAFGATVAYDEATQAVTAELNGVTVVMTIGSATYTVNGAEKTMDVAPFINGSRTMVPVRFAAEAFGIKVIPTYNPDGTTADILFNL